MKSHTANPEDQLTIRIVPEENIEPIALLHHSYLRNKRDSIICHERGTDSQTRDRWAVNYIRHNLTNYDQIRAEYDESLTDSIRNKTLDLIAQTYPRYAAACQLQKTSIAQRS